MTIDAICAEAEVVYVVPPSLQTPHSAITEESHSEHRGVEEGGVPNAKTLHPFSLAVALKVRGMANSILCASLFFPLQ